MPEIRFRLSLSAQHYLAYYRASPKFEDLFFLVEPVQAGDIGGQQIRGKLDTAKSAPQ